MVSRENVVYLVDSDKSIGEALTLLLGTYGICVRSYHDAESFVLRHNADQATHGCLLIADNLPDMNGLSLVKELRKSGYRLPIIVTSSSIGKMFHKRALCMGATDVLEKPLMNGFLLERLGMFFTHTGQHLEAASNNVTMVDGSQVTFRVMQPEDADLEKSFLRALSVEASQWHCGSNLKLPSGRLLDKLAPPHDPLSYAEIATTGAADREKLIGVARYVRTDSRGTAEFGIFVADEWQGKGIATRLLHNLTTAAAIAGIQRLEGLVRHDNIAMRRLARNQGFESAPYAQDPLTFKISKPFMYSV